MIILLPFVNKLRLWETQLISSNFAHVPNFCLCEPSNPDKYRPIIVSNKTEFESRFLPFEKWKRRIRFICHSVFCRCQYCDTWDANGNIWTSVIQYVEGQIWFNSNCQLLERICPEIHLSSSVWQCKMCNVHAWKHILLRAAFFENELRKE